jgi:glycosyltransferase involved in cell wall biosynthesis
MDKKVSLILPYYNRKKLLLNTLKSLEHFYSEIDNFEIIIVDDGSNYENKLNDLNFKLDIKVVEIKNKNGINPCYPYNVGVKNSIGDILVLSSPETFHTSNMFKISNNFDLLNNNTYLLFSVFCLTDNHMIDEIIKQDFKDALIIVNKNKDNFFKNLGELGYSYNNKFGSWYLHSHIKPSGLNFFTAITREKYYEISGFDERFRFGTGYDDDEFKERLIADNTEFIYYDEAIGIHINHEVVNNSSPTTNYNTYLITRTNKYIKNDLWGIN